MLIGCAKDAASERPAPAPTSAPSAKPDPATPSPAKDAIPMDDKDKPITKKPPEPVKPAPQDTTRYEDFMKARGTPITDKAYEDVAERIGDWGFFYHQSRPGGGRDRTGLDKAKHAIFANEKGDWRAFLTTPGIDGPGAFRRVAWLYSGSVMDPATAPKDIEGHAKLKAPTLTTASDGTITLQGFWVVPPRMSNPTRVTLTVPPSGEPTMKFEAAKSL
jgi:hypothetical protein